jgi:ferrous iron transport protein B
MLRSMFSGACRACALARTCAFRAEEVGGAQYTVALAGNPNTGKSTVFNALTGLRQHTGNWPGKTVSRAEGRFVHEGSCYRLVDLPGTYSLLSASTEEEIARNFILFGRPDCTVVVVDATALERNLNFVFQVLEITDKVVVCVNLMDEARRKGIEVDVARLSRELGVPAVATSARQGEGLHELVSTIADVISGRIATAPKLPEPPPIAKDVVDTLVARLLALMPTLRNPRWIAYRLIEGDYRIRQALLTGELARLAGEAGELPPGSPSAQSVAGE